MSKKFIEALENIKDDEMLYIGAKNGNGFIIIETKSKVIELLDKALSIPEVEVSGVPDDGKEI